MVPPDGFNIEWMEQEFHNEFKKYHINIKIVTSIYESLKEVEFAMTCPCFLQKYKYKDENLFYIMR